jgi:hypothetical protein
LGKIDNDARSGNALAADATAAADTSASTARLPAAAMIEPHRSRDCVQNNRGGKWQWNPAALFERPHLFMLFDASLVEQFAQMGAHRLSGRSMEKFRYVSIDPLHYRDYLKRSVL